MARMNKEKRLTILYIIMIVIGVVFFGTIGVLEVLQNRPYEFEGSEALAERLEAWTPQSAETTEPHSVDGAILYYSIDCFKHIGSAKIYKGMDGAKRKVLKSDVQRTEEIGVIAVLLYDRTPAGEYTNGADAWRDDCDVYLLEPDTLAVLAYGTVSGGNPPSTTSGGDRYGSRPLESRCREKAAELLNGLNR